MENYSCKEFRRWKAHWYWKHREPTKIRFSRLLIDTHQELFIPRLIVSKFREQFTTTATLKNLSGQAFTIRLQKRGEDLAFKDGWSEFVSFHCLKNGDTLMFEYGGDSTFNVSMFDGESGYEKQAIPPSLQTMENSSEDRSCDESFQESSHHTTNPIDLESSREELEGGKRKSNVEIESDDEDYTPPPRKNAKLIDSSCSTRSKSICRDRNSGESEEDYTPSLRNNAKITSSSYSKKGKSICSGSHSRDTGNKVINLKRSYPTYFISERRPVAIAEKEKAYELARRFPTSNPSFIVAMLPTHVYKRFFLTIPQSFVRQHIPSNTKEIMLSVLSPRLKTWFTKYDGGWRSYGVGLNGGWMNFVWDNNLEEGDVCVFQLNQQASSEEKLAMDVKIFRAVKKVTKLKKVTRHDLMKDKE